ncbi:hypothetical protein STEG23_021450, partial [Scotinomys teguina]
MQSQSLLPPHPPPLLPCPHPQLQWTSAQVQARSFRRTYGPPVHRTLTLHRFPHTQFSIILPHTPNPIAWFPPHNSSCYHPPLKCRPHQPEEQ